MDVQKTMDSFVLPLDKVKIVCYHFNKLKQKTFKGDYNMKKLLAFMLSALLLASLFVSCGGEKKMVVVGYTVYKPMNYTDENGKLIGFDTELAEAVFDKLGYTVTFKEINWNQKYLELEAGTVDCLWNGFTANTADDDGIARSEKVDFSYNYMLNKQVVVTTKALADTVTGMDSFAGKVGSAEKGSAGYSYMDNLTDCVKKDAESQVKALQELTLGTTDFVVLDEQLAKAYVGTGDYADLAICESVSSDPEYYAIGFKKGSSLTSEVNRVLEELAADGTIAKLAEKYGVSNTAITDFSDQK